MASLFEDLGFDAPVARDLELRAEALYLVQQELRTKRLSQIQAAALLDTSQPRISDLMRGRLSQFNLETLIEMLARLNLRVGLSVSASLEPVEFEDAQIILIDCDPFEIDAPTSARGFGGPAYAGFSVMANAAR